MMNPIIRFLDGWMSDTELEWLYNTARSMPEQSLIVEIGAWKGKSTGALYTGAGINKAVVTVDTWQGQPDLRNTAHKEVLERDIFQIFINNMRLLGINPLPYIPHTLGSQYLYSSSIEGARFFDDNSISLLFIDGDHTKVDDDIVTWYPKVKFGGIISGHDYSWYWTSVRKSVDDRLGKLDGLVGSIWVKQKARY